ncbi:hypothetical protein AOLI_G00051840 [Acnodon oligacanthus]
MCQTRTRHDQALPTQHSTPRPLTLLNLRQEPRNKIASRRKTNDHQSFSLSERGKEDVEDVTEEGPCFATILEHAGMKWKREEERAGVGGITQKIRMNDMQTWMTNQYRLMKHFD